MRRLPLAYSCDRRWREMQGTSNVVRRCVDCGCDVVNLSALDEASARALLAQQAGPRCIRYRYVGDEIVFAKAPRRFAIAAAAAVLLAAAPSHADTAIPQHRPPPRATTPAPKKKPATTAAKSKPPQGENGGLGGFSL